MNLTVREATFDLSKFSAIRWRCCLFFRLHLTVLCAEPAVVFEVAKLGFTKEHIIESLQKNLANHCATTYYLLDHDQVRLG